MSPRVSYISPTYNQAKYLLQSITCILNQSDPDFEILLVDDGSTDDTQAVIRSIADARIRAFRHQTNKGNMEACWTAYREARGEYIAFLTTDDLYEPSLLEKQLRVLTESPAIAAVFCDYDFIGEEGNPLTDVKPVISSKFNQDQLLNLLFRGDNRLCCPGAIVRKNVFEEIGFFSKTLYQTNDMAKWIDLLFHAGIYILPEILVHFRMRDNAANMSAKRPDTMARFAWEHYYNLPKFHRNIQSISQLTRIFPEVLTLSCMQQGTPQKELIPFYLSQLALSLPSPPHHAYALLTLQRLLEADESVARLLEETYHFGLREFFTLTGTENIFGVTEQYDKLQQEHAQLLKRNRQLESENTKLRQKYAWTLAGQCERVMKRMRGKRNGIG